MYANCFGGRSDIATLLSLKMIHLSLCFGEPSEILFEILSSLDSEWKYSAGIRFFK